MLPRWDSPLTMCRRGCVSDDWNGRLSCTVLGLGSAGPLLDVSLHAWPSCSLFITTTFKLRNDAHLQQHPYPDGAYTKGRIGASWLIP